MQPGRFAVVKLPVRGTTGRLHCYSNTGENQMKFNSAFAAAIALSFAVAGLTACEKGPAEKAGEKIDNTVNKVGNKMEEAGDKVKDAVKK
jgi:hypothetical protein